MRSRSQLYIYLVSDWDDDTHRNWIDMDWHGCMVSLYTCTNWCYEFYGDI